MSEISFAQSYILASKVKTKLSKQASDPKSSLRNLVVQANMLDNLMDYIGNETEKRCSEPSLNTKPEDALKHVSFDDQSVRPPRDEATKTSVTEYEVDSDSDSDGESDLSYEYSDSDSESDSDYYYSDSDEEEAEWNPYQEVHQENSVYKKLPYMNLSIASGHFTHTIIEEEEEEENEIREVEEEKEEKEQNYKIDLVGKTSSSYESDLFREMPELCRSSSLTDDEDFEEHLSIVHSTPSSYLGLKPTGSCFGVQSHSAANINLHHLQNQYHAVY